MVSTKEKIAYGLGDTASNIIFQTVMLFLTYFYTNIFGISPAYVGTMFLAVRLIDAITDPLMGWLSDQTRTRFGRFRPYLLWFALPFGIISVLTFTTPDLSESGKLIYAFVTYTLLMMVYTAINIPYCALGGVLTTDPDERVSVQSYRFVFAMLGGLLVSSLTLPLVDYFGQGDKAQGYQYTILAMSILGVCFFLICFMGTRERDTPNTREKLNFSADLKALLKNDQWRILCVAATFLLTGLVLRTTIAIYYVQYYLGVEDMITYFITLGMIGNILGCATAQPLAKHVCKVKAYITLQWISATLCVLSYFIAPDNLTLAFGAYFVWNYFTNMGSPLLWAKMADTIDYGHWKTGVRITGMLYSSIIFFIKLGLALGGAFAGWLLAAYGYQADSVPTEQTLQGILLSFTLYPAIAAIVVAFVMRKYTLNRKKVGEVSLALKNLTPNH
ncbi:glycoside-pentoside-hexuronide (GPH):cation symporter [Shewanella sp. NIFS-20-20]|uniref:glycoside-pentoside-hexuronide (GPH):cation symporter n=1 Tax=Shewanella sp. NIFS-20-20 TaxID=2853806 RepID=UPI001C4403E0|nr:glycoside-pentoside-hexuronide (GPH):cation symporter [Shewanella sp. NIFS-20-20]MBV7314528.1 glycoside-pentoside-hexuronide (GPH):cation symporter [Shewanella sp. NIFS-20-20]